MGPTWAFRPHDAGNLVRRILDVSAVHSRLLRCYFTVWWLHFYRIFAIWGKNKIILSVLLLYIITQSAIGMFTFLAPGRTCEAIWWTSSGFSHACLPHSGTCTPAPRCLPKCAYVRDLLLFISDDLYSSLRTNTYGSAGVSRRTRTSIEKTYRLHDSKRTSPAFLFMQVAFDAIVVVLTIIPTMKHSLKSGRLRTFARDGVLYFGCVRGFLWFMRR